MTIHHQARGGGDLERFAQRIRTATAELRRDTARARARAADGAALRRARAVTGLSQRELASELGWNRSALAAIEGGLRPLPERIARWVQRAIGRAQ